MIDPSLVPVLEACFVKYQVCFPEHKEWVLELIEQLVSDAQEHCCSESETLQSLLVIEYPVKGCKDTTLDASRVHKGNSINLISRIDILELCLSIDQDPVEISLFYLSSVNPSVFTPVADPLLYWIYLFTNLAQGKDLDIQCY